MSGDIGRRVFFGAAAAGLAGLVACVSSPTEKAEAQVYAKRGLDYLKEHDFEKAIDVFSSSIKLDPTQAEFFTYRGLAHYSNAQARQDLFPTIDAIKDLEKSLTINDKLPTTYAALGFVYKIKTEYKKAFEYVQKAQKLMREGSKLEVIDMEMFEMLNQDLRMRLGLPKDDTASRKSLKLYV